MRKLFIALGAVFVLSASVDAQATPTALIIQVNGSVNVKIGDADPIAAAVGAKLNPGDQVIPAGGEATVFFTSGRKQSVDAPLTIAVQGANQTGVVGQAVGVLASAGNSNARSAPNRQGMIRPLPGQPVQISPRNGLTIANTRPTFRWMEVSGANGYMLQLRREGGEIVRFDAETNVFTLPDDVPALTPGATYFWTIAPKGGGRPATEQSFTVIGGEDYTALQEELTALTEADLDPMADGLFFAATIYREAGLFYEAAAAMDFLEKSGSPMSAEVWLLRGEIYDMMGRLEDATAAFDRADELMR